MANSNINLDTLLSGVQMDNTYETTYDAKAAKGGGYEPTKATAKVTVDFSNVTVGQVLSWAMGHLTVRLQGVDRSADTAALFLDHMARRNGSTVPAEDAGKAPKAATPAEIIAMMNALDADVDKGEWLQSRYPEVYEMVKAFGSL